MQFGIKHILIVVAFVAVALTLLAPIRGMFPPFYYEQYTQLKTDWMLLTGCKFLTLGNIKTWFLKTVDLISISTAKMPH